MFVEIRCADLFANRVFERVARLPKIGDMLTLGELQFVVTSVARPGDNGCPHAVVDLARW